MEYQKLVCTKEDGICTIEMNYPKNLNAIDEVMVDELNAALENAEKDNEVKVVVIKGSPKAFSAGGDIRYFYDIINQGGTVSLDGIVAKVGTLADRMKSMSKLIITSVSGACAGAGVSLALGGDFIICAEDAKFILAFVNLGLVPDTGAVYLLSRCIGTARTMELAATGRPVGGAEAAAIGMAYKAVPADELDGETEKFAKKLAKGPLLSYKSTKKQIYEAEFKDYRRWLDEVESETQRSCAASDDFKEGVKAFIEKRKPEFTGK